MAPGGPSSSPTTPENTPQVPAINPESAETNTETVVAASTEALKMAEAAEATQKVEEAAAQAKLEQDIAKLTEEIPTHASPEKEAALELAKKTAMEAAKASVDTESDEPNFWEDILNQAIKFLEGIWANFPGPKKEDTEEEEEELHEEKVYDETLMTFSKNEDKKIREVLANTTLREAGEMAAKHFGVPQAMLYAFVRVESNFNAGIKNSDSSATGLGQFIDSTWKAFQEANVKEGYGNADRRDPKAALFAVSWYIRNLSDNLGIPLDLEHTGEIYHAYHDGPGRYKKVKAYQENGTSFKIPDAYIKRFPSHDAYVGFIQGMQSRVTGFAKKYQGVLLENDSSGNTASGNIS